MPGNIPGVYDTGLESSVQSGLQLGIHLQQMDAIRQYREMQLQLGQNRLDAQQQHYSDLNDYHSGLLDARSQSLGVREQFDNQIAGIRQQVADQQGQAIDLRSQLAQAKQANQYGNMPYSAYQSLHDDIAQTDDMGNKTYPPDMIDQQSWGMLPAQVQLHAYLDAGKQQGQRQQAAAIASSFDAQLANGTMDPSTAALGKQLALSKVKPEIANQIIANSRSADQIRQAMLAQGVNPQAADMAANASAMKSAGVNAGTISAANRMATQRPQAPNKTPDFITANEGMRIAGEQLKNHLVSTGVGQYQDPRTILKGADLDKFNVLSQNYANAAQAATQALRQQPQQPGASMFGQGQQQGQPMISQGQGQQQGARDPRAILQAAQQHFQQEYGRPPDPRNPDDVQAIHAISSTLWNGAGQ